MNRAARHPIALVFFTGAAAAAQAQTVPGPGVSQLDLVQVTADRFAEPVQEVPSSIEVITAEEMRARGVNDLRTALSLVGGVYVAPGGDQGPGAAVPGLLGQREVDDLLLLVDGVPQGGAFIPQFATLDLDNVERIEVQRGPAPVLYGTTSFEGTINIIHFAAGQAARRAEAAYGSYGTVEAGASMVLAQGPVRASLGLDGVRDRYADPRAGLDRAHALLRTAAGFGGGEARLDFDANVQHQKPSSPRPLADTGGLFDPDVPLDYNQNPADGKIDTNRFQLTAGYDKKLAPGSWSSTLSLTQTHSQLVQGFLRDEGDTDTSDGNAGGFHQKRDLSEVYFDSHLTHQFDDRVQATFGAGELWGLAHQNSQLFGYTLDPGDGGLPPPGSAGNAEPPAYLSDQRSIAAAYTQVRWKLTPRLGLLGGLRLTHSDERRGRSSDDPDEVSLEYASTTRLNGSFGANWCVWQDPSADLDDVVLYANYGNTFQPPEIDFGPDVEGPLLRPEALRSYEAGMKADGFDGRFDADLSFYYVDFDNLVYNTVDDAGEPTQKNGGRERYKGAELEMRYRLMPDLRLSANYSYNDARYRDFVSASGKSRAGFRLPLSPRNLAALGLVYGGSAGPQASLVGNYVGNRYLNMGNSRVAGAFISLDATVGYAFGRYTASFNVYNLTDRRDAIQQSELGEDQYYQLPGRRMLAKLSVAL
ncbi:MAG TPA: TonB-dependent receptor [Nevskia sp.]|nr:TonB-dependent receptor [Nevskia sp.]